ncbi:MAG TPA: radical SAM protein [Polyangium sp.]|nr:radical SAM protein [Polyangium sp.]
MKLPILQESPATVPSSFEVVRLHEIDLNITNRCNLDCIHCAFASSIGDANELPYDLVEQIVLDARALGCEDIHLTGGEPTIHREFERILSLIMNSGIFTRLISNGTMTKEKLRRYRDIGLGHLLFSVDGLDEAHDRIRGQHGAFRKTIGRAKDALELGYHLRVNAVAMRDNLHEILPLFELCEAIGVQLFSVFLYSPTGRNARRQLDYIVDPHTWRAFKEKLRARALGSRTEVFVEKGFLFRDEPPLDWDKLPGRGGGCHYLSRVLDYLIITGDGNVFPCALLNDKAIPYGNIYQRRLAEIIRQPEHHYRTYESFREPAGKCNSCGEFNHCHGGCRAFAYAFHQAWDHPDPQCRREPEQAPEFIPLCPLFKENFKASLVSGFSEKLS